MPFIIKPSQPTVVGVRYPKSVYSRIVGVRVVAGAAPAGWAVAYGAPVGNRLWLKSIWVNGYAIDGVTLTQISFELGVGVGKPTTYSQFRGFKNPLPCFYGDVSLGVAVMALRFQWSWSMNELYEGETVRFAVAANSSSLAIGVVVTAWFEISEV